MKKLFRAIKWLLVVLVASSVGIVLLYRWLPAPITPLMVMRYFSPADGAERFQMWEHQWVPLEQMSPWMPKAVVASEDQRFYQHHGFDVTEIQKAVKEAERGKRHRGASTITQQTAKNLFLWPCHSWLRKGLEAYFTVLIELLWPKERILEVYLNSIEMAPGIYGTQAMARHAFGVNAVSLTKSQCALIAAALPNPAQRNPAAPSSYLRRRAHQIMRYM